MSFDQCRPIEHKQQLRTSAGIRLYNPRPDQALTLISQAKRISVVGCYGSGKTTLSTAVAARLQKPLVRLDDLYWLPDWKRPIPEDWLKAVKNEIERPTWIMDGNHIGTLPLRLQRTDLTLHLDLGTTRCLLRVLKRDLHRALGARSDLPKQLRMSVRSGHHIAFWRRTVSFPVHVRPQTIALLDACQGQVIHFTKSSAVRQLMESLPVEPAPS